MHGAPKTGPISASITRRTALTGAAALVGGLALTRTAFAQSSTPVASPASGEWIYTDVLGHVITLPERPVRIAAYLVTAAALWDFGIEVVAVFDSTATAYPDGDHPSWGNIDISKVANVGDVDGNLDLEALLNANPDLIVTLSFDPSSPDGTVGVLPDVAERIAQIAPVLVATQGDALDIELGRNIALAQALGADLDAPNVVADRAAFEAKVEEFTSVAAEKSDLSVIFANISSAELYIAGPKDVSDLKYLTSLGLNFSNADEPTATDYWEQLSIEQIMKYPADLIYSDVFSEFITAEELQAQPVLSEHPAIAAGQVGLWPRDFPLHYAGVTGFLETILEPLRTAQKL